MSKTVSVEIVPSTAELVDIMVKENQALAIDLSRTLARSAFIGKLAKELKKQVGHGKWIAFIKSDLEPKGLPERTIRQHMETWEHCKNKALKTAKFADLTPLLEKPMAEMKPQELEQLELFTAGITDGETISSLADAYGKRRNPKTKGGARQPKQKTEEEKLTDEQMKLLGIQGTWEVFFNTLHEQGMEKQTWKYLPAEQMEALGDAVFELNAKLQEALQS